MTSVTGDRVSVWREEQDKWTADFKVWKSHIEDTGSTSQGAESSVDPSELWMDNLSGSWMVLATGARAPPNLFPLRAIAKALTAL